MTSPCLSRTVARTFTTFTLTEMVETGVVPEFVSPVPTEAVEVFCTSPLDCAAAQTNEKASNIHAIQAAPDFIERTKGLLNMGKRKPRLFSVRTQTGEVWLWRT